MNGNLIKRPVVLLGMLLCLMLAAVPALAEELVIYLDGVPVEEAVLNLSERAQFQFTASQPVTWKSSKTYRATVDENGLLTVKSASDIVLTATASGGETAQCRLEMAHLVTGISISGSNELAAGKRVSLKAAVFPSDASNRKVTWSSSDESVAQVSSSGRVTAQRVDGVKTAVITATARDGSGVFAQHTVTVMPAAESVGIFADGQPVPEIYLDLASKPTMRLSAAVYPAQASQGVSWKSSNASRVQVDENGNITALKTGSATITATAQDGTGKKATVKVRVVRMVTGLQIEGAGSVLAGRSIELDVNITPKDATEKGIIWESSNPAAVTVNKYGVVKAQKVAGLHTIVVTARARDGSGVFAQHTVTVTPRIESLQILANGQPASSVITVDLAHPALDLKALIQPQEACQEVRWTSGSEKRAAVDANGVVTALNPGTVTITAAAMDGSSVKETVKLRIIRAVQQIEVYGDTTIAGGERGELNVRIAPANATERGVVWESSAPDILSINRYGDMRAASVSASRQVTVYARAKDGSGTVGSVQVTVLPCARDIAVYSGDQAVEQIGIDLEGSRKLQLSARVDPGEALQWVQWSTSNKKRAAVDQNGLVTGLSEGKVTITATAMDGSGVRKKITVNVGVMVKNVSISGPAQVTSGETVRLQAWVMPTNVTDDDVIWMSENESIAQVSKRGEVTGGMVDAPAQVKIYAVAEDGGGAVGEYTVTVIPSVRSISIGRTDAGMPASLILNQNGGAAQLTATAYPAAALQQVSWRSTNKNVVTVTADGRVTAHSAGQASIIAEALDGSGLEAELRVGVGDVSAMPYYLEVDHENQVVRVYERGADGSYSKLIKRMICSTGRSSTPGLPDGLYAMQGSRMVWMSAMSNTEIMALYATRIKGHFLFHSSTYDGRRMDVLNRTAYEKLGTKASAGCIRLLAGDAKWIHDNVPKGCFTAMLQGVRDVSEYGAVSKPPLVSGRWDPTNPEPGNPDFDPTYTSDVDNGDGL